MATKQYPQITRDTNTDDVGAEMAAKLVDDLYDWEMEGELTYGRCYRETTPDWVDVARDLRARGVRS